MMYWTRCSAVKLPAGQWHGRGQDGQCRQLHWQVCLRRCRWSSIRIKPCRTRLRLQLKHCLLHWRQTVPLITDTYTHTLIDHYITSVVPITLDLRRNAV